MLPELIDDVVSAKNVRSDHLECLHKSFEPLNALEDGLAEKVSRFVCEGAHPEIPLWLANNPAVNADHLYRPGRNNYSLHARHFSDAQLFERAEKAVAFRNEFYSLAGTVAKAELAEGDPRSIHVLIRLGQVLQATGKGHFLPTSKVDAPQWLLYLLNDLLYSSRSYEAHLVPPSRKDWSLLMVHHIALESDLPLHTLLCLMFESLEYQWQKNILPRMLQWEGSVAWLVEQKSAIYEAWKHFSADDKTCFIHTIATDKQLTLVFSRLIVQLAVDNSKRLRDMATSHLYLLPQEDKLRHLNDILVSGTGPEKEFAVFLLEVNGSAASQALLDAKLTATPDKALKALIQTTLDRMTAIYPLQPPLPALPKVEVPPNAPLSDSALELLLCNWQEMRAELQKEAEDEISRNLKGWNNYKSTCRQEAWEEFQYIDESWVHRLFQQINKLTDVTRCLSRLERRMVTYRNRLSEHPEFTLWHALNINFLSGYSGQLWCEPQLHQWLKAQENPAAVDLRCIAARMPEQKRGLRGVAAAALVRHWETPAATDVFEKDAIWPFFAEYAEYLDEAMGLRPVPTGSSFFALGQALRVIETFPEIPQRYVALLMNIACGDAKTHRLEAQALVSKLPGIQKSILALLYSAKQDKRLLAAEWLGRIQATDTIAHLVQQFRKEKSDVVRGTLLKVLETLGADITPYISPSILLKEATTGLAKKMPAALSWFPFDALPSAHWKADGSPVAPEILHWWVVFAFKLKAPGGNPLLKRYLDLLAPKDAAEFSRFILHCFVGEDTTPISDEAAAEIMRQSGYIDRTSRYATTAMPAKGILALINRTPAHELVTVVRGYMRDHYQRIGQTAALVEACAASDDPLVIQFLLSVARRYRSAGIQELAKALASDIAMRNGWTQDQLADRTIPTAGYDDSGIFEVDYAGRRFIARLDSALKPELRNSDGKIVKGLPAPRKDDDVALIKEGRALWNQSKKELKQVIELQTARLYEAMCTGRVWPAAEWQACLLEHPVMSRLIQQLVWLQTDEQGVMLDSFRPAEDGSLLNTNDDELALPVDSFVRLAHSSLMDEATEKAWLMHFSDYKIRPLFAQLDRGLPKLSDAQLSNFSLDDYEGWLSDAFTIRAHLTRLGYQRGAAEDALMFFYYYKDFAAVGVRVCIYFTGNWLPEENVVSAITRLEFQQLSKRSWGDNRLTIGEVPAVLLGEAYADYASVAKAGRYDDEWKSKVDC